MCSWLSIFSLKPKWGGSRSWCTPGRPCFIFAVVYTPTWDSSKSWCALGCPSFLLSLNGVVAGVGVPLATHPFFLFSFAVVVVVVVVVVYTPTGGSSKSWCALGCPCFLLSLSGVVAGVGVPLAIHLCFFVSFSFFLLLIHPCGTVTKAGVLLAVHLFF